MDKNLYRRIVQYASVIAGGDALLWSGLYTPRSVYNLLKNSGRCTGVAHIWYEVEGMCIKLKYDLS